MDHMYLVTDQVRNPPNVFSIYWNENINKARGETTLFFSVGMYALAGWFIWLEHYRVQKRDADLIPSEGTYQSVGSTPDQGTYRWQQVDASLSHLKKTHPWMRMKNK